MHGAVAQAFGRQVSQGGQPGFEFFNALCDSEDEALEAEWRFNADAVAEAVLNRYRGGAS